MFKKLNIGPNERVLVTRGFNDYSILGPGQVWLFMRQQVLATLNISPTSQSFTFTAVQTLDGVPVEVALKVSYQLDPDRFTSELLPKLPGLNDGGWLNVLQWQTEYILRQLLSNYTWQDLGRQKAQQQLERLFSRILAGRVQALALEILKVYVVKIVLPPTLQETIIRAEQDKVEAMGRAQVLKDYVNVFGDELSQAMPYVVQWELLNMLRKQDNPNLVLAASNLSLNGPLPDADLARSTFPMALPVFQEGKEVELEN